MAVNHIVDPASDARVDQVLIHRERDRDHPDVGEHDPLSLTQVASPSLRIGFMVGKSEQLVKTRVVIVAIVLITGLRLLQAEEVDGVIEVSDPARPSDLEVTGSEGLTTGPPLRLRTSSTIRAGLTNLLAVTSASASISSTTRVTFD